jgi:choloylglycine hydrolase
MSFASILRGILAAGVAAALVSASLAFACTGIRLKAADGSVVSGRTLEFGFLIPTDIVAIPRGHKFASETPIGPGLSWTSNYATVGAVLQGTAGVLDGLNEKGLAVGVFYFPTFASYAETTKQTQARSVSIVDFATWMLTNFATLDEIRAAAGPGGVVIAPTLVPGFPPEPQPVHLVRAQL